MSLNGVTNKYLNRSSECVSKDKTFTEGQRFTNLNLSRLKTKPCSEERSAASGEKVNRFQKSSAGASLRSFEKGGKSNPVSREFLKTFTQQYNQTLAAGNQAMLAAPNSPERISGYKNFNAKLRNTLSSAEKLGMPKDHIAALQRDLFKPLLGEGSKPLKGSATEQVRTVANRYGFTTLAKQLNADQQLAEKLRKNIYGEKSSLVS